MKPFPLLFLLAMMLSLSCSTVIMAVDAPQNELHIVLTNQTLASIAKEYGITAKAIADYNNLSETAELKPGMVLFIPLSVPLSPVTTAPAEPADAQYLVGSSTRIDETVYLHVRAAAEIVEGTVTLDAKQGTVTVTSGDISFTTEHNRRGHTYVPLRDFFDRFHYRVDFDDLYTAPDKVLLITSPEERTVRIDIDLDTRISWMRYLAERTCYSPDEIGYKLTKGKLGDIALPMPRNVWLHLTAAQLGDRMAERLVEITLVKANRPPITMQFRSFNEMIDRGWSLLSKQEKQQRAELARKQRSARVAEIHKRHPSWNVKHIENALNGCIMLNMPADLVVVAWGYPDEKNRTVLASGVHEQWVYSAKDAYVYIDNGICTGWQD